MTVDEVERGTRQDVAEVLVRYATGLDRRDWALFRSCFTEDCDADYGDIGHWHDAGALTSWMEQVHAACGPTLHRITNQTVVRDGDAVAARSYVDAVIMGPDGATGTHAIGFYDDLLQHGAGGWQIASRTFTMVLVQPVGGQQTSVLEDVEAVKQLKARYFRAIDTKDWDALRQVFSDDVTVDTTASGGNVVTGANQFVAFLREAIGDVVTVHHGHTPEIEVTSPSTATGVWGMEDRLRWPDGRELRGYGHYHETYEKAEGSWRISTLKLTRLRLDMIEPGGSMTEAGA